MNRKTALETVNRVAIFVDVQNMWYCTKNSKGKNSKLNYGNLLKFIANGRDVAVAEAFLMLKEEVDANKFANMLYMNGFDVKKKWMEFRDKSSGRENIVSWDVGMTIEMIKWMNKVDTICLVSGSGAFVDVVEYMKNFCRIEVVGYQKFTSNLLKKIATDFVEIDQQSNTDLFMTEGIGDPDLVKEVPAPLTQEKDA